jgi:hypothetical protein
MLTHLGLDALHDGRVDGDQVLLGCRRRSLRCEFMRSSDSVKSSHTLRGVEEEEAPDTISAILPFSKAL